MNERQHAQLARDLIAACGGLDEAAAAAKISRSQLSRFQIPGSGCFMSSMTIDRLQTYCKAKIFSEALTADQADEDDAVHKVWEEACEATESAAQLQHIARIAENWPGGPTPRQRSAIEAASLRLEAEARHIRQANERGFS